MNNIVFTYRDTVILLGCGALIFLIGWFGSLFVSCICIVFICSFGDYAKRLSKKFELIDEVNKVVNDGVKKKS